MTIFGQWVIFGSVGVGLFIVGLLSKKLEKKSRNHSAEMLSKIAELAEKDAARQLSMPFNRSELQSSEKTTPAAHAVAAGG